MAPATMNSRASMLELLAASLEWWKVDGAVAIGPDGALLLTRAVAPGEPLRIARAPAGVPFRWQVTYLGRTRSVSSVAGVLRTVRAVVDPEPNSEQRSMRARVGRAQP